METTKKHDEQVTWEEDILDDDSFVVEEEGDGPSDLHCPCEDEDDL